MTRLSVQGLRFRYGSHEVLSGVDLVVESGSCLAVVGRNGSGKSTLVRVCVGRERPSDGRVTLDGRPVDDDDPQIRRHLAVLSGSVSHYPDLTVREHLELLALAHATPEPSRAVDEALAQVSLEGAAEAFPHHLSSGQAQALRLAALRVRPRRVVVLDEPEQHLDGAARAALGRWIAAEAARGTAVLLVSHDPVLVDACADRVLTLVDGTLHDDALHDGSLPDAATAARDRNSGPEDPDTRLERRIDATT
ncbi:MAG: type transport system ATP-binding protein [Actinomycetota bacterium]|nr:type transport system ATP-binding protein [Actinomycetota bacterium]